MTLLIVSFLAGVLTILAPCMLPVLPIIIGGSVQDGKHKSAPLIITASLATSIILFTLLLKFSTALIEISPKFWSNLSGSILILLGIFMFFPKIWSAFSKKLGFESKSKEILAKQSTTKNKYLRDILIGFSLGPVFSSCSPTYFFILATVLPESFGLGFIYLLSYSLGLSIVLLLIAYLGQKVIGKLKWAAKEDGIFKKGVSILFILIGISILFGIDKKIETKILDNTNFGNIIELDQKLLDMNN